MSTLKIGIIGTGLIARRHVAQLEELPEQAEIVAAVDLTPENADWLVARTGATYYHDIASALPHIDAAYLLTPPRVRVEAVRVLAEAGKAVFCEKPLSGTIEDAHAIAEIVGRTGVPFMMGFMRRWHPPYAELKKIVDSADLGRPLHLYRRRLGFADVPAGNWRVTASQLTGVTIESISHDIDLLRWLGGDIVEAAGEVAESRPDLPGYDDVVAATFRFASGATGAIQMSWASLVTENAVGVLGTERGAVVDGPGMWRSDRLRTGTRAELDVESLTFPESDAVDDGYQGQTRTFLAVARGERADHPGIADGVATVEISQRILDSSHGR